MCCSLRAQGRPAKFYSWGRPAIRPPGGVADRCVTLRGAGRRRRHRTVVQFYALSSLHTGKSLVTSIPPATLMLDAHVASTSPTAPSTSVHAGSGRV